MASAAESDPGEDCREKAKAVRERFFDDGVDAPHSQAKRSMLKYILQVLSRNKNNATTSLTK